MTWPRLRRRRTETGTVCVTAPAFAQLEAARERQLAWTREFARASDVPSALEAFLDADAIAAELLE